MGASKDDLFTLKVGSVGSPSSASFTVSTQDDDGTVDVYTTRTAEYTGSGYTGITYPSNAQSFIGNNTELSKGSRELLHVVGLFTRERIYLLINGEIVSSTIISGGALCKVTNSDFYIGGKGGEFRGHIEAVHWKRDSDVNNINAEPFMKNTNTIGLWRFEEPVEVDNDEFYIQSNASANDTVLDLGTTQFKLFTKT